MVEESNNKKKAGDNSTKWPLTSTARHHTANFLYWFAKSSIVMSKRVSYPAATDGFSCTSKNNTHTNTHRSCKIKILIAMKQTKLLKTTAVRSVLVLYMHCMLRCTTTKRALLFCCFSRPLISSQLPCVVLRS